jgi:riboflavin kinase/FMN adenylyltransferase
LFDFEQEIYGTDCRVEVCQFFRPEQKFPNLEELKAQIQQDEAAIRAFFHTA